MMRCILSLNNISIINFNTTITMSKESTQAQVAAEVAVANAETAVVESANDTITGIVTSFNYTPAKDSKTGRAQNRMSIDVEGEDDEIVIWPLNSQIENALSLNDLVVFCDVIDVRERRKNVLFRGATVKFHYEINDEGYENAVIESITFARASKTAALSGINQPHYLVQVGLIDQPELDISGAYYICHQREPDGSYYIWIDREIDISYCICPHRESALRADGTY